MGDSCDVTAILADVSSGDPIAVDRLLPLVYEELRGTAKRYLNRERSDHTLQATALVHEVYLRLVRHEGTPWRDRAHFFAVGAQVIRHILVDHARSRASGKRGGGRIKLSLEGIAVAAPNRALDFIDLDAALVRLQEKEPRKAQVVEMRFFGGLTVEEVAEVLKVSARSVERDWQYARAWLFRELGEDGGASEHGAAGGA